MTPATQPSPVRRTAARLLFVALVACGIDPSLLRLLVIDRGALAHRFAALPDAPWSGSSRFLAGVRAHTRPGDTLALAIPDRSWDGGYAHAYYRASYVLTGREVLPLLFDDSRPRPENLARADYVVLWGPPAPPGAPVVWRDGRGSLVGRR